MLHAFSSLNSLKSTRNLLRSLSDLRYQIDLIFFLFSLILRDESFQLLPGIMQLDVS